MPAAVTEEMNVVDWNKSAPVPVLFTALAFKAIDGNPKTIVLVTKKKKEGERVGFIYL